MTKAIKADVGRLSGYSKWPGLLVRSSPSDGECMIPGDWITVGLTETGHDASDTQLVLMVF